MNDRRPEQTNHMTDGTDREPDEWGRHGLDIDSNEDFEGLRSLVTADMERLGNRVELPLRIEVDIRVYDRSVDTAPSQEDDS